ncbi:MAG: helix-turn-helix domain-containing protein [Pyrinomonadaceae bacterium]
MSLTLGQKLRQAREARGISVSEVAEQTRISPHYIDSIENDDYKTLPGGIFNKGFVKSYARFIGFDEQEALADYSRMMNQSGEGSEADGPRVYRPEVLTDDHYSSSRLPSLILAAVILALMTVGVLYLVSYLQNRSETSDATNTAAPTPAPAASPSGTADAAESRSESPSMGSIKVRFSVSGDVYLTATNDGKRSEILVRPDAPAEYEPKQSLALRFHGSRAGSVNLTINDRPIALPAGDVSKGLVSLLIDASTLPAIWQSGRIEAAANAAPAVNAVGPAASSRTAAAPRPRPGVSPSPARPTASPAASPRPR